MTGIAMGDLEALQQACELRQQGLPEEAQALCEELLQRQAWSSNELCSLARSMSRCGFTGAALLALDRALAIDARNVTALCNRGVALEAMGRADAALASYEAAIALEPGLIAALVGRSNVLQSLGRLEAAVAGYDHALGANPELAAAHSNRGLALLRQGRLGAATASFDAAISRQPDFPEALAGRAAVLRELNHLDEALADYDRAIALRPDYAEAYFGRAVVRLLQGSFEQGWRDFEWRWNLPQTGDRKRRTNARPLWLGEPPIAGKTLLVQCEKGLGDSLQFCRYVPLLAARGITVILQVQAPLLEIVSTLDGVALVLAEDDGAIPFDHHCPLLSLPLVFGTTLVSIPAPVRYLRADAHRVARARAQVGGRGRPRIGLVWRGDPGNPDDHKRSMALGDLLQGLPAEFRYIRLQRELSESERRQLAEHGSAAEGCEELNFVDTAALCECLDLIISVDTSVAHLSAALGRETWILLPFSPDCRWLLGRSDSPWYPSVRLFRQRTPGAWNDALVEIAGALRRRFPGAGASL